MKKKVFFYKRREIVYVPYIRESVCHKSKKGIQSLHQT